MMKVLLLYVEAGFGHRKAAEAVASELKARGLKDIQIENQDALEKTNWLFRRTYAPIYHQMVVRAPWLWGFFFWLTNLEVVYPVIRPLRTLWNWCQSAALRAYLQEHQFDFILFTHFFPAEVAGTLKRRGLIASTLITVVTDVIPHHVWQNAGTDLYWVMADESRETLIQRGASEEQILIGGIPISNLFTKEYNSSELESSLGLKKNRLTILFTSGSFGIGPTSKVLESLKEFAHDIQILVVCGLNQKLFQMLNRTRYPFPVILFGLIKNMHEIMSLADLLIAKPGGITMCESLAKRVPMIILAPIPGQETYNAQWLIKHNAAFQVEKPGEVNVIVSRFLNDQEFENKMRKSVDAIRKPNAASDLVDFILNKGGAKSK